MFLYKNCELFGSSYGLGDDFLEGGCDGFFLFFLFIDFFFEKEFIKNIERLQGQIEHSINIRLSKFAIPTITNRPINQIYQISIKLQQFLAQPALKTNKIKLKLRKI